MRNFWLRSTILHSPEGGAGAGGAAASAPAGGAPSGAAGGAGGANAGGAPGAGGASGATGGLGGDGAGAAAGSAQAIANAFKAPEFLPEHLRGPDAGATLEKLSADWKGLRDKVAAFSPGKAVDDYVFNPSDKVKPFVGDLAKDPVYATAREAALKAGVPPAAFQAFVGGFYEALVDGKKLPQPYNALAERAALLGPQAATMSEAQQIEAARPIVQPLVGFLDGLKRQGMIDDRGYVELGSLLDSASGVRALAAIYKLAGQAMPGGPNAGGQSGGGDGKFDLAARMRDPRQDVNSPSFDRKFRDETYEMAKKHYG